MSSCCIREPCDYLDLDDLKCTAHRFQYFYAMTIILAEFYFTDFLHLILGLSLT